MGLASTEGANSRRCGAFCLRHRPWSIGHLQLSHPADPESLNTWRPCSLGSRVSDSLLRMVQRSRRVAFMARCTAPVEGHRTASGAANCPACRGSRTYSFRPAFYSPAVAPSQSSVEGVSRAGASGSGGSRRLRSGKSVSYSPVEWRTFEPFARNAAGMAQRYPERRDLFLCHAWDDRQGAAKELCNLLVKHGATVWFSEYDVALGTSLLTEIDKGLRNSRVGVVLVTPAMLKTLDAATGIASKELSALLATDRVIPVAHGTDFDALRDVSPLLGARSGLTTSAALSLDEVAQKVAAAAAAA